MTPKLLILIFSAITAFKPEIKEDIQVLADFSAQYDVLRNGKVMAKQTTSLKKIAPNQYLLNDNTTGTHGMASFTGFQRAEGSHFVTEKSLWTVQKHNMRQKVAFSKRTYEFSQNNDIKQIEGKHKNQSFVINHYSDQPISSHMLPLRIAFLTCHQGLSTFEVSTLKSKKINRYRFTVSKDKELFKISRQYPESSPKSSDIWLDPNQNCLPIKTKHHDGEDLIETQLKKLN